MKGRAALLLGGAVGYVLGSRAGRKRYDQISAKARGVWQSPTVQERADQAQRFVADRAPEVQHAVVDAAGKAAALAKDRLGGGSGADEVTGPDLAPDVAADKKMHGG